MGKGHDSLQTTAPMDAHVHKDNPVSVPMGRKLVLPPFREMKPYEHVAKRFQLICLLPICICAAGGGGWGGACTFECSCLQRLEECVGSSGARLRGGCEPLNVGSGN